MKNGIANYVGIHEAARRVRDLRSTHQLAIAVVKAGERVMPFCPSVDDAAYMLDQLTAAIHDQKYLRILRLSGLYAGLLLETEAVGVYVLHEHERHDCRAMIARHDTAEGPSNLVIKMMHG